MGTQRAGAVAELRSPGILVKEGSKGLGKAKRRVGVLRESKASLWVYYSALYLSTILYSVV